MNITYLFDVFIMESVYLFLFFYRHNLKHQVQQESCLLEIFQFIYSILRRVIGSNFLIAV